MSKKKAIIRVLKQHSVFDTFHNHNNDTYDIVCDCAWEGQAPDGKIEDLHAEHVYSILKEALKKRKQIKALGKGTNGTR